MKTSIIIFDNNEEKTTEVKFSNLVVERYLEDKFAEVFGDIVIIENKDDIIRVTDKVVSCATKDEILENAICSLNGKDYNKKEIVVGEGYELVKLGDMCESQNGYAFKTEDYKKEGIPLITITHIKNEKILFNKNNYIEENDKYKKYEIKYDDIIISLTGKKPTLCSIAINDSFQKQYLNQRCALLRNFRKINKYYFASIFSGFMLDYINKNIGNGSNQENVSLTDILNIAIPIPKSQDKIQEWADKISAPYNEKNEKQNQIKELETFVKNRIREIGENEECDEFELGSVCEINPEILKKNQLREINYIDISSVKEEKINNIQNFTENFPSRAKRLIKKNDILFSTVRPNLKGYTFINTDIKNGVASSGFVVIRSNKINSKYIYTLLKDDKITEYLICNSTGTSYPAVNPSIFGKIKIKIPKNKNLIEELETHFQQIETFQNDIKVVDELYKQLIQELSQEAIPQQKTNVDVPDTRENISEIQEEIEVNVPKKKITKKTTKKTNVLIIEK